MTFYGNNKTVSMLNRFIDRQELPQSVLITGYARIGRIAPPVAGVFPVFVSSQTNIRKLPLLSPTAT